MSLKIPVIDTADYRLPPEVEAALGGRDASWRPITGWLNGWGGAPSWAAAYPSASYRKDASGFVHLRGLASGPALADIATLPAGFRPGLAEVFPATAVEQYAEVTIYATGLIHMGVGVTGNQWLSLSGISFLAEG